MDEGGQRRTEADKSKPSLVHLHQKVKKMLKPSIPAVIIFLMLFFLKLFWFYSNQELCIKETNKTSSYITIISISYLLY